MRSSWVVAMAVAMVSVAGPASAVPSEGDQVFTDPTYDGPGLVVTPPHQDLVAGFLAETDDAISFTWQVADLPDAQLEPLDFGPLGPLLNCSNCFPYAAFHWEFSLNPDLETYVAGCAEGALGECYSVSAYIGQASKPFGALRWGCGPYEHVPVVSCNGTDVAVKVEVDGVANTVTATVPRDGFLDYSAGGTTELAVDGAVLVEEEFLAGIAAYTAPMGTTCDCLSDRASMDPYLMGTNRR